MFGKKYYILTLANKKNFFKDEEIKKLCEENQTLRRENENLRRENETLRQEIYNQAARGNRLETLRWLAETTSRPARDLTGHRNRRSAEP